MATIREVVAEGKISRRLGNFLNRNFPDGNFLNGNFLKGNFHEKICKYVHIIFGDNSF